MRIKRQEYISIAQRLEDKIMRRIGKTAQPAEPKEVPQSPEDKSKKQGDKKIK